MGTVVKDLSGSLTEKLHAIVRDELAARAAELDFRERELDARARDLVSREEALQQREAALRLQESEAATVPPQGAPAAVKAEAQAPKPFLSSGPTDAPTPSRARHSTGPAVPALFRPPSRSDSLRSEPSKEGRRAASGSPRPTAASGPDAPLSPPETSSAGAASQLKDLFEKKASEARKDSSPLQRRHSWRPVLHELSRPDGSSSDRYRAHEAPFRRVSTVPTGSPPQRRTLQDLLKADAAAFGEKFEAE